MTTRKVLGLRDLENNFYIISYDANSKNTLRVFVDNTGKDFIGDFEKNQDKEIYNELIKKNFKPMNLIDFNESKCFNPELGNLEIVSPSFFFD